MAREISDFKEVFVYELISLAQLTPATGDSFNPAVIAVIAGIAAVLLIVTTIVSKKGSGESDAESEEEDEE